MDGAYTTYPHQNALIIPKWAASPLFPISVNASAAHIVAHAIIFSHPLSHPTASPPAPPLMHDYRHNANPFLSFIWPSRHWWVSLILSPDLCRLSRVFLGIICILALHSAHSWAIFVSLSTLFLDEHISPQAFKFMLESGAPNSWVIYANYLLVMFLMISYPPCPKQNSSFLSTHSENLYQL